MPFRVWVARISAPFRVRLELVLLFTVPEREAFLVSLETVTLTVPP